MTDPSRRRSVRPRRRPLGRLAPALAVISLAACGGDSGRTALQVERDTLGDTIVVRTLAGGAWDAPARLVPEVRIGTFDGDDAYMLGDVNGLAVADDGAIFLYDRQVPALRKYAPDGTFEATFGRQGGGPGEYERSDGGLAVLSDGRVLLRDPANARINVYSATGESLDHWPLRGGYFTSRPLYSDTAGNVYNQIWGTNEAGERYGGLQRYGPSGETEDSILAPEWDFDPPAISFTGESISMMNYVPFSPTEQWTLSPHGYLVGGLSTEYSFDVFRPDWTVRIERRTEPIPVAASEKDNARARAAASFRRHAPDWKWNGPPIPDSKPPYRALYAGRDGRIWVHLWQPGEEIPADEIDEPEDPTATPPNRWREPVAFDVFEPDGTYLGEVRAPDRFSLYPQPIFGRDHVWAITTDELGVEYLTRFRIVLGDERPAG